MNYVNALELEFYFFLNPALNNHPVSLFIDVDFSPPGKVLQGTAKFPLRHIHSSLACPCDRPCVVTGLISCSSRQPWPCNCSPLPMWSEKSGKSVVKVNAPEKAIFQSLSEPVSWRIYLPRVISFDLFASTELTDHHWMVFVKWFQQSSIVDEQKTYAPSPSWCENYVI